MVPRYVPYIGICTSYGSTDVLFRRAPPSLANLSDRKTARRTPWRRELFGIYKFQLKTSKTCPISAEQSKATQGFNFWQTRGPAQAHGQQVHKVQGSRFEVPARTRIKVSSGTDGLAAPARRSRLDSTASTNENPRRDSPSVLHFGPWRLITSTPRLQVDARKKGCRHGSTGACIIDACLPNLWGFASP